MSDSPPSNQPPNPPSKFAAARDTLRQLGPAGVIGLMASTLPPLGGFIVLGAIPFARPWMMEHPIGGPAVALLAAVLLGGTMLMPTYSFAALCGASFGPVQGTLIAIAGIVLGGTFNVSWVRPVCGNRLLTLIDKRPKLALLHHELLRSNTKRTFLLLTLVRIPPGFPFSLTNFLVAALHIPLLIIIGSLAIGSIPRTALVATAASKLAKGGLELGVWPWVLTIGSTLLLLIIVSHVAGKALQRITNQSQVAPATAT